jgi:hypothetical protein
VLAVLALAHILKRKLKAVAEVAVVAANSHTESVCVCVYVCGNNAPAAQKVCHVCALASIARTTNLHAVRVATGERYEGDVPVLHRAQEV